METDTNILNYLCVIGVTASEITHIPEQFFTVTIKEVPDENFGIGGKSIDEIKRNYKP